MSCKMQTEKKETFVQRDYDFWVKENKRAMVLGRQRFNKEKEFELKLLRAEAEKLREKIRKVKEKKYYPKILTKEAYELDKKYNMEWAERNNCDFIVLSEKEYNERKSN